MSNVTLNEEQKEAVYHKGGPLMIIAGAGTGKTTVITERIKYLVTNNLAKPSEILALTFTEKAAAEMEERVDVAMPLGYGETWISTFHAFCDRVLRQDGLAIGLDTSYTLMSSAELMQFIKNNFFEFDLSYFRPLGNPYKFIGSLLEHFSRLQDEDIDPTQYMTWAKNTYKEKPKTEEEKLEREKWLELAKAYQLFNELKINNSIMDFGDLIVYTNKLFRERKNVLKNYQTKFKYYLIDEYQDTNIAQNELVKLLCTKDCNVTVVLDDDQSIYRFRGAAVSNAIQFRDNFPNLRTITLFKNYRTGQDILDKAYDLIQNNNPDRLEIVEGVNKKLVSQVDSNGEITFIHKDRIDDEAVAVVEEIVRLQKRDKELQFNDFAILVRANSHAEAFVQALKKNNIPCQFLGPGKLFDQKEIIELISYLRVLKDVNDSLSLFTVLSIPDLNISPLALNRMTSLAGKKNYSLYEICSVYIDEVDIPVDSKKTIETIIRLINKDLNRYTKETAGTILYQFLDNSNLLDSFVKPDEEEAQLRAENIALFFDKLKSYELTHKDVSLLPTLEWIELLIEEGESPRASETDWTNINAVNIITVHSSKGLEFPAVFLVNLVSQRFPSINRSEKIPIPHELIKEKLPKGDYHIQEERRLFYVGMTRAKKYLYFTAANYYGEGKITKKLSPFIFEALGDEVVSDELDYSKTMYKQLPLVEVKTKSPQYKNKINVDYLSYTQISTFETCPLHYKLRYVLKIPTQPTAPLSFGKTLHEVMRALYVSRINGEEMDKNSVIEHYNNSWLNEGYLNKKHEMQMKEKGTIYLNHYYDKQYKNGVTPLWIEHPFVVSLRNSESRLKIGGKIDRVDKFTDGSVEIVDYKTGESIPSQKEVDKNEQLTFYALAASKITETPFNVDIEKIKLSLYYFEGQQKLSTYRTREQLKDFEDKLFSIKKQIEESEFECSGNYFCNNCEYKTLCNRAQ